MSALVKWAPFSELDVFERRMRRMLEELGSGSCAASEVGSGRWTGPLPGITIHTGNPVGRERMVRVLRTIQRLHAMGRGRGAP